MYLHVRTVGINAENMRNNMQKNRQPALLNTLVASLPMPKYSRPIRIPTTR